MTENENADNESMSVDWQDEMCPRCHGPLRESENDLASGSRIVLDRSIRICNPCGGDEAYRDYLELAPVPADEWPVPSVLVLSPRPLTEQEKAENARILADPRNRIAGRPYTTVTDDDTDEEEGDRG
ncbi:hypothetical protein [Microbacterium sp. PRC9]|uniref:hypothetical protein n=1 Tax=Microbacterium sp. PRC9 TaxID=2962591 RepID=UPI002880CAB9|nr:hypothetical protein [Microbacterium sp. PRC9]MDT0143081.1 hypothetical protein [Microbacterium sp. PRC9]